jgi:hypothetical protein
MKLSSAIIVLLLSVSSFAQKEVGVAGKKAYIGIGGITGTDSMGFAFDAGTLWNKDFGWYGSLKLKTPGAKDSGISYQTAKNYFGDSEINAKYDYTALSVGRTYGFNDMFFVGAGVGYQSLTKLVEFYDPTGILGNGGKYHVKKDSSSNFVIEGNVMCVFPNNYYINLGYSNGLAGMFFGIGGAF